MPIVLASIRQTPSTITSCNNGKCTSTIYAGTRFVEESGKWVEIEKAKSLKNAKGITLQIKEDKEYPIKIIDWNYSKIMVELETDSKYWNNDVPLKYYDKESLKADSKTNPEHESNIKLSLLNQKQQAILNLDYLGKNVFDTVIKWGFNSTTVSIEYYTTTSGRIGKSTTTSWNTAHDATSGTASVNPAYFNLQTYHVSNNWLVTRGFLTINTSTIPVDATIESANIGLMEKTDVSPTADPEDYIVISGNHSASGSLTGAHFNDMTIDDPVEFSQRESFDGSATWLNFVVNADGLKSINKEGLSKFNIRTGWDVEDEEPTNGINVGIEYYMNTVGKKPHINITYTVDEGGADTTPPKFTTIPADNNQYWNLSVSEDFDATDDINFTKFTINYTSLFSINNITGLLINTSPFNNTGYSYLINVTIYDNSSNTNGTIFNHTIISTCVPNITNTSWGAWTNTTCAINDTMNVSRNLTQYDANICGASNVTFTEYETNYTCNYCSYNLVNTSWTEWANITICFEENSTQWENRSLIEWDENYFSCYNVTGIESDLYDNKTYWQTNDSAECSPPDLIPPKFTSIPSPLTLNYGQSISTDFDAVDETLFDAYAVNDTNLTISEIGILSNASIINVGIYSLNITINDTAGNTNGTLFSITINKIQPPLSLSITPSTSVSNGTETTATGQGCPSQLTCGLYHNNTAQSNPDIDTFAPGEYVYLYNTTGNKNYNNHNVTDTLYVVIDAIIKPVIGNITIPLFNNLMPRVILGKHYNLR